MFHRLWGMESAPVIGWNDKAFLASFKNGHYAANQVYSNWQLWVLGKVYIFKKSQGPQK